MSKRQTKFGFEFSCDACGEVWEPPKLGLGSEPRDFGECWELAKQAGFAATQVKSKTSKGSDWEHRCKDCK